MNHQEILLAKQQWDEFVANLPSESKKDLSQYSDSLNSLDLYEHVVSKDYVRFDQVINTLTKQYLFDDNIIQLVYDCYLERGLPDAALSFINEAEAYHNQQRITTSVNFTELRAHLDDQQIIDRLRRGLQLMLSIKPNNVPAVIPAILNGHYNFQEFILAEIVNALRVLAKKKLAIHREKENFINDILKSILVLRFPIWGWNISDQERSGESETGKDAGEVDFTITSAGKDLTLVEAFILQGLDTNKIQTHVKKCLNYIKNIKTYYLVIYYTGLKENFGSTWASYKKAIIETPFDPIYRIDRSKGVEDLNLKFSEVDNIEIGKSNHGVKELYHIMIDLS